MPFFFDFLAAVDESWSAMMVMRVGGKASSCLAAGLPLIVMPA